MSGFSTILRILGLGAANAATGPHREFLKGSLSVLGFAALGGGRLFAMPPGKNLTVAVRPLTSLGTYGRAIAKEISV